MDTVKFSKGNVKTVAHRGVSGLETENTLAAFIAAGNRSHYGVECDIHVTSDGKIIVIHDEKTGRVALTDINVEKSTFDEVRSVKLRNMYKGGPESLETRGDLIIPTLKEYVSVCKKYGKKCVIELKNRFEAKYITQVIDEINELDYLDGVIFISFSFENMVDLRRLLPNQPLQFLVGQFTEGLVKKLDEYSLDLDIYYESLDKEKVDLVHSHGHLINCWTVDSKEKAEELVDMGVDFITSNILE